jgi:methyltransferase
MVSVLLFTALLALVAVQRLYELRLSRRHERELRRRGGREHAPEQMKWMVACHAGWLVAMPLEVYLLSRPFLWPLAALALAAFAVGQALRYAAIRELGPRWTVRVITVPGEKVTRGGVFRRVRHPNYAGVILEIAALPLVHSAYLTSLVFSGLNALVLRRRIRAEEAALAADSDFDEAFRVRPRLVPR